MGYEFFIVIFIFLCLHWCSNAALKSSGGCDFFKGTWVIDETTPYYGKGSCPFIEKQFDCEGNGRTDSLYLEYSWQPSSCDLPRFNGQDFVTRFKGKKILFVGDSLSLNQWESLSCLVHSALPTSRYNLTKSGDFTNLTLPDYGLSITLHRLPFLVDLVNGINGSVLKLDSIEKGNAWKGYDMLIFNTWHWWFHTGAAQVWNYLEYGGKLYKDMDRFAALKIGLTTWSKWVDSNVNPADTEVFYQGVSPTHYDGREWNGGNANCMHQTKPLPGSTFPGGPIQGSALVTEVLSNMGSPVTLLDITELSQLRIDAHPSVYGLNSKGNDCSHWCLAGVPDTWNQILYAILS
ncbi:PC-Esterase [Dillenia turbinata]|uniref:PC-Esterase n=1 Tax=Dillenia turbinata TaxID=194707 RepID=A0AAN8ZM20_9MAGN